MARQIYRSLRYSALVNETTLAYKIQWGNKEKWVPKSQCILYKVNKQIEVTDWWFLKNDMHIIAKDFIIWKKVLTSQ